MTCLGFSGRAKGERDEGKPRPAAHGKTHWREVSEGVEARVPPIGAGRSDPLDRESRAWVDALQGDGPVREQAVRRLHALLLRAARFQVRSRASPHLLRGENVDDLATEAADDALVAVLARLDEFRGASRFTTWAYKFAILEASVSLRRRAWKGRELPLDGDGWNNFALSVVGPDEKVEQLELLAELRAAVETLLTDRQREVFVAVALNGVPIDVVAQRLGTTRGAVYKTLHDARQKLRAALAPAADADAFAVPAAAGR
jgi:RNA polymerase sigma-70 factor, ECF subfamily